MLVCAISIVFVVILYYVLSMCMPPTLAKAMRVLPIGATLQLTTLLD